MGVKFIKKYRDKYNNGSWKFAINLFKNQWVDGWIRGWMDGLKAVLRIAYSKKNSDNNCSTNN